MSLLDRVAESAWRRLRHSQRAFRLKQKIVEYARRELAGTISPDLLPDVLPLNLEVVEGRKPTLNVLIPGMAMGAMSGGPNTALNLTYRLAEAGVPVRYLSTNVPADSDHRALWDHLQTLTGITRRLPNVEIIDANNRVRPTVIGSDDVFFGTAWWTVQMIKHALPAMKAQRFLYIIQDFEPGLYSWSTRYALALETYGLDFRGIICSHLLAEHLCVNKTGRFADPSFIHSCATFEPAVDATRFYAEPNRSEDRKRQLLFYARPSSPRNLFELGLVALKRAVAAGAFSADEWELWFMGEPLDPVDLGDGVVIRCALWRNYDGYAEMLRNCDVGLSLMLSPHTSYPPIEMAACGAACVTNVYSVKTQQRLLDVSRNLVPVQPTLEDVVAGLQTAVEMSRDRAARCEHARLSVAPSWDEVFDPLIPKLIEMWNDCRHSSRDMGQAIALPIAG